MRPSFPRTSSNQANWNGQFKSVRQKYAKLDRVKGAATFANLLQIFKDDRFAMESEDRTYELAYIGGKLNDAGWKELEAQITVLKGCALKQEIGHKEMRRGHLNQLEWYSDC